MLLPALRHCLPTGLILMAALTPAPAAAQIDPALRDAFQAFFPMYEMARLRFLAVEEPANPVRTPVNRFQHARRLLDHRARTVTAPNNDTLYSSARLDLSRGPLLVRTPRIERRYYSLQFMNVHTDNIAILGSRAQGEGPMRIAVVGPGWQGAVPEHSQLVRADSNDLWLLVRTLVDGDADVPAVNALQQGMTIEAPAGEFPAQRQRPEKEPSPAQFLSVVNEFLARNPPQGAMAARASAAAVFGLRAGALDAWETLSPSTQAQWSASWSALFDELRRPASLGTRRLSGWEFPPPGVGQWGDDMRLRATVALRGIAALDASETLYLQAFVDIDGARLDGQHRYRVRIPPGGLPVRGFWSLTMYEVLPDGRSFLVDNPIARYSIGDRTAGIRKQPDGSFEVLLQADAPADTSNWLPTPRGPFRMSLRAYLPDAELIAARASLPVVARVQP